MVPFWSDAVELMPDRGLRNSEFIAVLRQQNLGRTGRMALRIEDYGLIGDMHTAALVGIDGSIDWLCLPRFDSAACFASLLGTEENGCWRIAPAHNVVAATRRYRTSTLVLETDFETADGSVRITDCMPIRASHPRIVRVIEGLRGTVAMSVRLNPRFDYGKIT